MTEPPLALADTSLFIASDQQRRLLQDPPPHVTVSTAWARLRLALRDAGGRMPVNDSWIAATAMAHGLSVVTQDDDYDVVPGLNVVKV